MTDPVGTKLHIQLQNGPMIGQRLIVVTDHFNLGNFTLKDKVKLKIGKYH